jgi:beta-galactosidase/beta-glucuronidase
MSKFSTKRASEQDGSYFRPQLVREHFQDLSGEWEFAFDDLDIGLSEGWHKGATALASKITVPFPPESKLSGIHDPSFHSIFWYRRVLTAADLKASGYDHSQSLILHFGAVDYRCEIWLNGSKVGSHEGGHVSFSVDLTHALRESENVLVLRVEDDPLDVTQPRGKQDWLETPHVIWYNRTSGIWQPVWMEAVSKLHVKSLRWQTDAIRGEIALDVEFPSRPVSPITVQLRVRLGETLLGSGEVVIADRSGRISLKISHQNNGQAYEGLLWSPTNPVLIDAEITVLADDNKVLDHIKSYLGIRTVAACSGKFLLNERPVFVRAVLEQGYWPESHLAAPSAAALKREVELIKELGFNTARIHQKIEDPRFLFWADKLGLMLWAEFPATFEFSSTAVSRITSEWMEAMHRDISHPSVVVWVPLNESWGVQHIAHSSEQQEFSRALYRLTKALDSTRPVISNDGWEHTASDLATIHDYEASPIVLSKRYANAAKLEELLAGVGPAGRRMYVGGHAFAGEPALVSEFGGIAFESNSKGAAWGYSTASSPEDFSTKVREMCIALGPESALIGFCYTQLTDTMQEVNGLLDENRVPKAPMKELRAAILGKKA